MTKETKRKLTGDLNQSQLEAVVSQAPSILVVAGAGTGKTTIITRKIAYLIEILAVEPKKILALTFTEKAALEMERRADELVSLGATDYEIKTFHAFGLDLLTDHAFRLGLKSGFKVLSDREQTVFLKENIFNLGLKNLIHLSNPTNYLFPIRLFFSRLKDELTSPEELREHARKADDRSERALYLELSLAYRNYQSLLLEHGFLDYGDLIFRSVELLKTERKVANELAEKYEYILVDELQDTNFAQYQLLKLLAPPPKKSKKPESKPKIKLMVVGDDDQAIYRFRGAAYSNILSFISDYRPKTIVLKNNYRSPQNLLDRAYHLIRKNDPDRLEVVQEIDKSLIGRKVSSETVFLKYFSTGEEERRAVTEEIVKAIKAGRRPGELAVLVRSNTIGEAFVAEFKAASIPHQFSGQSGLFSEPTIVDLVNLLRVLVDPNDDLSLIHLGFSDYYNFETNALIALASKAKRRTLSLEQIMRAELGTDSANPEIKGLIADLDSFRLKARSLSTGQVLYTFLEEKKVIERLMSEKPELEKMAQDLNRFFKIIRDFEGASSDRSIFNFANHLEILLTRSNQSETEEESALDKNQVQIMTVHAAKGLEFDQVFLPNLAAEIFPARRRSDPFKLPKELIKEKLPVGDEHLEEERRLFFVAVTRTKHKLHLSFARSYGGRRPRKASIFLAELLDREAVDQALRTLSAEEPIGQLELFQKYDSLSPSIAPPSGRSTKSPLLSLSHRQIDDYLTCPWKYRYINRLKMPVIENEAIFFGSAIHRTLEYYFQALILNKKTSLDELLEFFEQAWKRGWFINRKHEREREKQARRILHRFLKTEAKKTRPVAVEQPFKLKITPKLEVRGRIDLIYQEGDQETILDFKTGFVADQAAANSRVKKSLQLLIYGLAYKRLFDRFPARLAISFLDKGLVGQYQPKESDFTRAEQEIKKAADGIRAEDFRPKPTPLNCAGCPFKNHCPYSAVR